MKAKLIKSLCLLILIACCLASYCPSGILTVNNFKSLMMAVVNDAGNFSPSMNSIYQISAGSIPNTYYLYGFRLRKLQTSTAESFDVKKFSIKADLGWKIVKISEYGNCVIVDRGMQLVGYQTSSFTFRIVQTILVSKYTSVQMNEDCSIIRVGFIGSESVYQNSSINFNIAFDKNAIYDPYYNYGIGLNRKFMKIDSGVLRTISLDSTWIEDTPVQITNRKDLNALFIVTLSSVDLRYTFTVLSTVGEQKLFSKSWNYGEFSDRFSVDWNEDGNFVVARDVRGLLTAFKLVKNETSLVVTPLTLQKSDYVSYFESSGALSLNKDILITYTNKYLNYFQYVNTTLYYIGQLAADLQGTTDQYINTTAQTETSLVAASISPSELIQCYFGESSSSGGTDNGGTNTNTTTNTTNSTTSMEEKILDSVTDVVIQTVVDTSTGEVIKCQPECLQCRAGGLCDICTIGYSLSTDKVCIYCGGCKSCNPLKPQICYGCYLPQVIDPLTSTCVNPPCTDPNCQACDINGICQSCFKGYSIHNKICTKCPDGCPSCKKTPTQCDRGACNSGFVFYQNPKNDSDYSCIECATGCISCKVTQLSDCTACNEGFYGFPDPENGALRCTYCKTNCRSCTSGNTCDKCDSGYRLNADKTRCLEMCDTSCQTCADDNVTFCTSCYGGTKLDDNGACVADLNCNKLKTCTACGPGYALRNGECIECAKIQNCVTCAPTDMNTCNKCVVGFYLNSFKECVQCAPQCASCLNEVSCFSCSKGFFLSKIPGSVSGRCLACDQECKTCNMFAYLCTSCPENSTLDGSRCISSNNVAFEVMVGTTVDAVASVANQFKQQLVNTINARSEVEFAKTQKAAQKRRLLGEDIKVGVVMKIRTKDIVMNKIISASSKPTNMKNIDFEKLKKSSVLSGSISTKTSDFTTTIANNLEKDLQNTQVGDLPMVVLSTTAVIPVVVEPVPEPKPTSVTAIVVGVVVPVGLLLIAVIVGGAILMRSREKKYKDLYKKQKPLTDDYYMSEKEKSFSNFFGPSTSGRQFRTGDKLDADSKTKEKIESTDKHEKDTGSKVDKLSKVEKVSRSDKFESTQKNVQIQTSFVKVQRSMRPEETSKLSKNSRQEESQKQLKESTESIKSIKSKKEMSSIKEKNEISEIKQKKEKSELKQKNEKSEYVSIIMEKNDNLPKLQSQANGLKSMEDSQEVEFHPVQTSVRYLNYEGQL